MTTSTLPLVIIGTGLAGYSLAKEFRKLDPTRELILITQDDGHFYSKPQLSIAFEQNKCAQSLVVTDVDKMRVQLNAHILTDTHVQSIDSELQTIVVKTAQHTQTLSYGQCVLALGASPKPFPVLAASPHHRRVNSLQDYGDFRRLLEQSKALTIIGSGLVGCEFAHDFASQNFPITLVTPDSHLLAGLVPAQIGAALQQVLQSKGVTFHLQSHIQHIQTCAQATQLTLLCGQQLSANLILSAIGLAPNIALAQQAQIDVAHGIVVNDYLQTSAAAMFALGDCAQILGSCRQFVAPILHCARALAQTLCGKPTAVTLPVMPILLKISSYPVIVFPPHASHKGEWQIVQEGNNYQCLFYDEADILQGYALSGTMISERQNCLQQLGKACVGV